MEALRNQWFPLHGAIDELRIYARDLSDEDIRLIYSTELYESHSVRLLRRLGARLSSDKHGDVVAASLTNAVFHDRHLKHLTRLHRLTRLDLGRSSVTDEGLAVLATLIHMKNLDLRNTAVTDEAQRKLAKKLPRCRIRLGKPGRPACGDCSDRPHVGDSPTRPVFYGAIANTGRLR